MCIKKQYTQSESSKNTFEHNNVQEGPYGRIMTVHVWDSAQRTFKKNYDVMSRYWTNILRKGHKLT